MTDTIELRGLHLDIICGVDADERQEPQPIRIDADVALDADRAAATDDIDHTVDYGALAELAASVAVSLQPRLLESLCDAVARAMLDADDRVLEVTITAAKLHPPIPLAIDTVGVRRTVSR